MQSGLSLKKEIFVASIHEGAATRDGAANAVAQMIARIPPVGIDAPLTNQSIGELAM
ncbi:msl9066 (plasmid) [Mesorhizobium japonicum MAFF 303099]|uniref:Msl9066 protein n=1 Tax=Mesorhizobium japonicum (strain LMG 29417 / CECT 9101 / MAFF 303099) TaxID=266835 RepID=Q982H8_RHILO|nr:msl9066 [Mesorhizobium japonicum MAFF 303099]